MAGELEGGPDHQLEFLLAGPLHQVPRVGGRQDHRLLHKDMDAGVQSVACDLLVEGVRNGDHHALDLPER